jgi:hypothetical protein
MIRNLTPHPVRLYRYTAPDVVNPAEAPDHVFPVSGPPARLAMVEVPDHPDAHLYPVEAVTVEYGHVTGLPARRAAGDRVVYYLVSLPVALALPERDDLLVPYREVRDGSGTVVGCRALARPIPRTLIRNLLAPYATTGQPDDPGHDWEARPWGPQAETAR